MKGHYQDVSKKIVQKMKIKVVHEGNNVTRRQQLKTSESAPSCPQSKKFREKVLCKNLVLYKKVRCGCS